MGWTIGHSVRTGYVSDGYKKHRLTTYPDPSTMSGYLVKRRDEFPYPTGDFESLFVGDSIAIVLRR